ncbi:hypothetical protein BH10BAC3_BH10BAC3_06350 [soil metagenome]
MVSIVRLKKLDSNVGKNDGGDKKEKYAKKKKTLCIQILPDLSQLQKIAGL